MGHGVGVRGASALVGHTSTSGWGSLKGLSPSTSDARRRRSILTKPGSHFRPGALDRDIAYRGAVEQIRENAFEATRQAIAQGVPRTYGRLGSRAHAIFERLNIRSNGRLRGSGFDIVPEQFRGASPGAGRAGPVVGRRARGSKGLDAVLRENGTPLEAFDLKTGRGWSQRALLEYQRRFQLRIEEIFTGGL